MMKHALLTLTAALSCAYAAFAQAQEDPIRDVISDQIAAFEADDFATAFTYASPTIQDIFGTPENFGVMVRNGFPMVWRPADLRFLGLETRDGVRLQGVMIRDREGRVHVLEYEMIEGEEGWKINGVRLRAPAAGTA